MVVASLALAGCGTAPPDVAVQDSPTRPPRTARSAPPQPAHPGCADLVRVIRQGRFASDDQMFDSSTGRLEIYASAGDFVIDVQDDAACIAGNEMLSAMVRGVLDQSRSNRRQECTAVRAQLAALPAGQRFVVSHGLRVEVTALEAYRDDVCGG